MSKDVQRGYASYRNILLHIRKHVETDANFRTAIILFCYVLSSTPPPNILLSLLSNIKCLNGACYYWIIIVKENQKENDIISCSTQKNAQRG